jgi:ABC-type uncharacterized transport system ATPase subunit
MSRTLVCQLSWRNCPHDVRHFHEFADARCNGNFGVNGIDLRVPEACIFGFLGPNGVGAGYSTASLQLTA